MRRRVVFSWRNLLRIALIALPLSGWFTSCGSLAPDAASRTPTLSYRHELQSAIDRISREELDPYGLGISAAVLVPGYQTWVGVGGTSHADVPITVDMVFDAGSIAKNFEAALTLEIVQENRLSLDDPISRFLPAYPNIDSSITIRQLLNHTSGVYNVFEHPDFPWAGTEIEFSKDWELEQAVQTFVLEPYGRRGHVQHYSSTNYLLLTAILQALIGAPVSEEIDRRLIKPLELNNTFVSMGEPPPPTFSVAHPWIDLDGNGKLDDLYGIPLNWKATLTHPVLFSTPKDLVHWMNALYHEGTVLQPDSIAEMLTFPEKLQDPEGGRYGLGVVDYTELLGVEAIGHGGSSLGYAAAVLYLPESGISLAWIINTGESPQPQASEIMERTWSLLSDVILENQGNINP